MVGAHLEPIKRELLAATRAGDVDAVCKHAKQLASVSGCPANAIGRLALVFILKSVEQVVREER